jgi:hypothetical protein
MANVIVNARKIIQSKIQNTKEIIKSFFFARSQKQQNIIQLIKLSELK